MISVLKDCFDKKNNRYKVISFNGDKYQCQSYSTGKSYYFLVNEISDKPFKHEVTKPTFTETKKAKPERIIEPVYEPEMPKQVKVVEEVEEQPAEPVYEFEEPKQIEVEQKTEVKSEESKVEEIKTVEISKDNIKETADDFYADF